jgi:hypothetical protein
MTPEVVTTVLILGLGVFLFVRYASMQREQEQATEDLRKLRLDLHQNGWNPDRIDRGIEVQPTEADFQHVIDQTHESLRRRGLRAKPGFLDGEDDAERLMKALTARGKFRFSKGPDGHLRVSLAEEAE